MLRALNPQVQVQNFKSSFPSSNKHTRRSFAMPATSGTHSGKGTASITVNTTPADFPLQCHAIANASRSAGPS